MKLFMLLLGTKPPGRHTEQHDVFFGIGNSPKDLIPLIKNFWPEAIKIHVDAWREVKNVGGYQITVMPGQGDKTRSQHLFFINLGGYKTGLFDEPHYKVLTVQDSLADAVKNAKGTAFYEQYRFAGAESHVDDRYGVDVDDLYNVEDILPAVQRKLYSLNITPADDLIQDELHLGYFKLEKLP